MKRISIAGVVALIATFAFEAMSLANSGVPPSSATWTVGSGATLGAPSHRLINGVRVVFFVGNGKLYAYNAEAPGPTGLPLWSGVPGASGCVCPGGALTCCQGFSLTSHVAKVTIPINLSDGSGVFVFVADHDGHLYKVKGDTGEVVASADMRRVILGSPCLNDALNGAPLVQRGATASAAFRAAYGATTDLIYVPTAYDSGAMGACATHEQNEIVALRASDLTPVWRFGGIFTLPLDYFDDGCDIDPATDTIYCAAHYPAAALYQDTLVALRTHQAGKAGVEPLWATEAGDISVRPFFFPQSGANPATVYVATNAGQVKAYNAVTGDPLWNLQLNCLNAGSCKVVNNFWAEFRGGFNGTIVAVTMDGRVHSVLSTECNGLPCGVETWWRTLIDPTKGSPVNAGTAPVVDSVLNKIFVGANDGRVHQLNLTSGYDDGSLAVSGAAVALGDMALENNVSGTSRPDRMSVGNLNGTMARFCIPFTIATSSQESAFVSSPTTGTRVSALAGPICKDDGDCQRYAEEQDERVPRPFWIVPECNKRVCDRTSGTCHVVPVPNDEKVKCDDHYACTDDDVCIDGRCLGQVTRDPSTCMCNAVPIGGRCLVEKVAGQCCSNQGSCFDTSNDPQHCGTCGARCSEPTPECIGGSCCQSCGTGKCVNLQYDEKNCGACRNECPAGRQCIGGKCD